MNPAKPLSPTIAVVIPCFRVREAILGVLEGIGPVCQAIYVVDDACPENTGDLVESECRDPRVQVVRNPVNQGVGGATIAGYLAALEDGAEILVKLDGDGQMDPALIPRLVSLIEQACGCMAEKILLPMQPGDVPTTFADIDATARDFGYAPTTPIAEGIPAFVLLALVFASTSWASTRCRSSSTGGGSSSSFLCCSCLNFSSKK